MTIGEMIGLLCSYCSNEDDLLMCRSIYEIEVENDCIYVVFTDSNTPNIKIEREEE